MPGSPGIQGYAFDRFRIDLASYQLHRDGQVLTLTPKAFDTLVALVSRRDRVVEKDELMNAVWPDAFVSEDNLTQAISVLRRTLGDHSNQPRFIVTIARHGYRFIAPVNELREATALGTADAPPVPGPAITHRGARGGRTSSAWATASACIALLVGLGIAARSMITARAVPSRGPLRFTQEAPEGAALTSGGLLSPDGHDLLFVARDDLSGKNELWVRALDEVEPRRVAGTEDAVRPFWSPDSQSIAFFAGGKLKRAGLGSRPVQILGATATNPEGGTWSASGVILFAAGRSGLASIPAAGGAVTVVTTLDPAAQEVAHRWPQFLPDGRRFLYFVESVNPVRAGTYLGSLDATEKTRLLDVPAVYAPTGHLLYIRERVLAAQSFDATTGRLSGPSSTLAGNVMAPEVTNGAVVSASIDGLLAFSTSRTGEHFEWFGRAGERLGSIDAPIAFRNPAFLPGQRQLLAASSGDAEHKGLWTIDVERGALTRIAADGMRPIASPDGSRIAFTSDRAAGVADLYVRATTGRDGEEELLLKTGDNKFICDWSADGRYLVFGSTNARTQSDLWLLPMTGDRQPHVWLQTPSNEICGQISPDGRWMAYTSDESGTWQVYVQSFPEPGNKQTVSVGGGIEPHWRADGRELFYLSPDQSLMAVGIKAGATWQAGRPATLFRAPLATFNPYLNQYAVTADGRRVIINAAGKRERRQEPITVLVNWKALLGS